MTPALDTAGPNSRPRVTRSLSRFDSPRAAVLAANDIQVRHQRESWPPQSRVRARIGVHVGEIAETSAGLVGLAIHHGARIAASAHGGQIVVSDMVRALCEPLGGGIESRELGVHRLHDVGSVPLFQVTHPDLDDGFPPLRARGGGVKRLPAPMTPLIGRAIEADEVAGLLREFRLVTLTGPGGSGKTRLALHVASMTGERFEDGVWFVDLATVTDDDLVLSTVRDSLGMPATADPLELFAGRSMLIVLDNCEQVIAGSASAARRLLEADNELSVLATSRQPLAVAGEAVYRVPTLSVPADDADMDAIMTSEAGQLFLDRARRAAPGYYPPSPADVAAVARLCRHVDGIPLALELVAPLVRTMGAVEIVGVMQDRLHRVGAGAGSSPRHQTLEATIDWSYHLLNSAERRALAAVSVFPASFDLAAACAVCPGDIDAIGALLALHDKSLVASRAGPSTRYYLLDTIRGYAAQTIAEMGSVEIRARHAHHYYRLVEDIYTSDAPGFISRLVDLSDREHDNVAAAVVWFGRHEPERAVQLFNMVSDAMCVMNRTEPVAALAQLVPDPTVDQRIDDYARWFVHRTMLGVNGYPGVALREDDAQEARQLAGQVKTPEVRAVLFTVAAYILGALGGAGSLTAEAATSVVRLAEESGRPIARLWCRLVLSNVANPHLYLTLVEEAARIAQEIAEPEIEELARLNAAWAMAELGRSDEALSIVRSALGQSHGRVGRWTLDPTTSAFAILNEGEHGDIRAALVLIEDLCATLATRAIRPWRSAASTRSVAVCDFWPANAKPPRRLPGVRSATSQATLACSSCEPSRPRHSPPSCSTAAKHSRLLCC